NGEGAETMRAKRISALAAVALFAATMVTLLRAAEYDPIFDFMPLGGRSLLSEVLESKVPAAEARGMLTGKRSRDEWMAYLKDRTKTIAALKDLDEQELLTLADYMSFNMPLPAASIPADLAKADWRK